MSKTHSQAVRLPSWKMTHSASGVNDPHYGALKKIDGQLVEYLMNCLHNNKEPELFISAWYDKHNVSIRLRLAIPDESQEGTSNASLKELFCD